ncbi:hypothetical protein BS78_02G196600 [Paspalum vaginatum]|nr:hypothetical protein BS78_02G196600 [Paspalum vaginatum]
MQAATVTWCRTGRSRIQESGLDSDLGQREQRPVRLGLQSPDSGRRGSLEAGRPQDAGDSRDSLQTWAREVCRTWGPLWWLGLQGQAILRFLKMLKTDSRKYCTV